VHSQTQFQVEEGRRRGEEGEKKGRRRGEPWFNCGSCCAIRKAVRGPNRRIQTGKTFWLYRFLKPF